MSRPQTNSLRYTFRQAKAYRTSQLEEKTLYEKIFANHICCADHFRCDAATRKSPGACGNTDGRGAGARGAAGILFSGPQCANPNTKFGGGTFWQHP